MLVCLRLIYNNDCIVIFFYIRNDILPTGGIKLNVVNIDMDIRPLPTYSIDL